jgi:acetyltransferase-like isoleucine patch superfamily enzyme
MIGKVKCGEDVSIGPHCLIGAQDLAGVSSSTEVVTEIGSRSELRSNVVVGCGTKIAGSCWVDHHSYVGCLSMIGKGVQIMYGARIYHRVTIGDGAWIAGFICNDALVDAEAIVMGELIHKFFNAVEGEAEPAPTIGHRVFVGMGAKIIGGIRIGPESYVAAGAIVTRDVPPGRLYAGVPAVDVGKAPSPFRKWPSVE